VTTARLATIALVVLSALATGAGCSGPRPIADEPTTTLVTVDITQPGTALPSDFLGLSFEASVLGSGRFDPARSNLAALLRDLGTGRLRFGGNSVDRVAAWTADGNSPLPSWAHSRVDPQALARLGALATATGWKVDLGLTLGHPDPAHAADEVAAAARLIGSGLGTVQVGNEPDVLAGLRPGYGEAGFRSDVVAYRAAIVAAAPGVALSGPGTAEPAALARYAAAEGAGLAFVTQHFYPFTRCGGARPTVGQLLSATTLDAEARLAATAVAAGRALGVGVRIDETNSASCGGQDGVSNTLASALWIVEYLVTAAQHGVAGFGIQGGLAACRGYTPLCAPGVSGAAAGTAPGIDATADASLGAAAPAAGPLAAQPDFYGLLLVHELEGGRWLPLATTPAGPGWAAALAMPDGAVRVVIVNPSPDVAAEVTIRTPGLAGRASVQRLTGPTLAATRGVELGGAAVGTDGVWRPHADTPVARPAGAGGTDAEQVVVGVPAAAAALVTISPR
jgi:hypothetical protein